jgi:hypothetical protein
VSAEMARLEAWPLDAERLYEQAIRSAREHGFVECEGFYAERGFEPFAQMYLRNARYCYLRWGDSTR